MGAFKFNFNPLTGQFDEVTTPGYIPEYKTHPSSPPLETAWVLATASGGGAGGGSPIGLLLSLTTPGNTTTYTYQLSYQTAENTTIRTALS